MGILDSLLGLKTNDASNKQTRLQTQNIYGTQNHNDEILRDTNNEAITSLQGGANSALGNLAAGYGNANTALTNYGGQAQAALTGGVNQAVNTVQGSNAAFQPFLASGTAANAMYGNSLGLNGAAGNTAAQRAFQASPGYQFQVDQATDAAARKASSLGMAASGNTLDAITRLASNLASNEYGGWQDRLNGVSGQGLTAAGAISGNNNTAAGYQYGGAGANAGILQQMGQLIGANDASLGTAQATINSGLGTGLATLQNGLGSSLTANNWTGATDVANLGVRNAAQQDATQNANNSIFSSLISNGIAGLGNTASGQTVKNLFSKL